MLNILYITFYIKTNRVEEIKKYCRDKVNLYIVETSKDFKKMKDIKFDYILTLYYWKMKWANYIDDNKFIEIPNYINYKHIIYQDSNPLSSLANSKNDILNIYRFSIDSLEIIKQKNIYNKIIKKKMDNFNFQIKPYKKYDKKLSILILLQNYYNHFINMTIEEYQNFIQNIINEIRKYSENNIILRYKIVKNDNDARNKKINISDPLNNMKITGNNPLIDDINSSYVAIAHSTNAVLKAIFEGLHIISLSKYCLCDAYSDHDMNLIEKPNDYKREDLMKKIISCSWNFHEFENGLFIKYLEENL